MHRESELCAGGINRNNQQAAFMNFMECFLCDYVTTPNSTHFKWKTPCAKKWAKAYGHVHWISIKKKFSIWLHASGNWSL